MLLVQSQETYFLLVRKWRALIFSLALLAGTGCLQNDQRLEAAISDVKEGRFSESIPVLEVEANEGSQVARTILARLYASGMGVSRDRMRAQELLSCVGQNDCRSGESEYYLALEFYEGAGIPKDPDSVLYWMRVSADAKYVPASQWLAQNAGSVSGN